MDAADEVLLSMRSVAKPDAYSFSSAIRSCEPSGDLQHAEDHLREMRQLGVPLTEVVSNAMLAVCASAGDVPGVQRTLEHMQLQGVLPDMVSYHSAMAAAVKTGDPDAAIRWYWEMKRSGLEPDAFTYTSVVSACVSKGDMAEAEKWVAKVMEAFHFGLDGLRGVLEVPELSLLQPSLPTPALGHGPQASMSTSRQLADGTPRLPERDSCKEATLPAFSLQTAEEAMKAHAGAIKAEADKEYAFDADMVRALARGLSLATVCVAEALASDQELAKHKFCRACFAAVATLLDVAAALREERCPPQLWKPVQAIAEGQEGHLSGGGDPVLSAWMMYDSYAKGLADRPSAYEHNLPRMRIAALLALKDAAAAAVAMLQGDSSFADISAAGAVDAILDTQHLKACRDDIAPLREFYPQGLAGEEEDDTIEPWHKF
ncbi:unnamed protein product [Effrenium voratum]|nr:unnamed protein product [Effrenium voratum]